MKTFSLAASTEKSYEFVFYKSEVSLPWATRATVDNNAHITRSAAAAGSLRGSRARFPQRRVHGAMVRIYKTAGEKLTPLAAAEEGCWVNAVAPSEEELGRLAVESGVVPQFLRAALDEEETSRVETENGQTMLLFGVPYAEKRDNTVSYAVTPVAVIVTARSIVTVSNRVNSIETDFADGLVRGVHTDQKTRFVLQLAMRISARYLQYLRQINKIAGYLEKQLGGSLHKKELIQLFDLRKSLVYFSASIKADEITLEKLLRGRVLPLAAEERDLLEEILVEMKQAVEMAGIYSNVLSGTIEAFSAVRANGLNQMVRDLLLLGLLAFTALAVLAVLFALGLQKPNLWFPFAVAGIAMAACGTLFHYRMKR